MPEISDDKVIGRNLTRRLNQLEEQVNLLRVEVLQLRRIIEEGQPNVPQP